MNKINLNEAYTEEQYYYAINYNKLYNHISNIFNHYDDEKAHRQVRWLIENIYDNSSSTSTKALQDVINNNFPQYKKLHDTIALLS